jgi:hypothetical protein
LSRTDRQMAARRAIFLNIMKRARCPKDNGKMLETAMPDVVCEKCSTAYTLAIGQAGFWSGPKWKLVEK